MKFEYNKTNQYWQLGRDYKKNLKRISDTITFDEFKERDKEDIQVITLKLDGEFVVTALQNDEVKTYSPGEKGTIRYDFEATMEMKESLKGYTTAVFFTELYAVDEDDNPLKFNKVKIKIDEAHGKPTQKEARIGIFDIHSLNGIEIKCDYEKRYQLIQELFEGNEYCYPVNRGDDGVEMFEKYVNTQGYEGLVIRLKKKVLKVKNLFTFDGVIYAVEKAGKRMAMDPVRFGSVRVGMFLPNGDMIDIGKVGSGWNDEERIALHEELMKDVIGEDNKRYYVKAKHIIEVGYFEMMSEKMTTNFGPVSDGVFDFETVKESRSYGPRFPKRIRYEEETVDGLIVGDYPMISEHKKEVTPEDIGVRQVPELSEIYS